MKFYLNLKINENNNIEKYKGLINGIHLKVILDQNQNVIDTDRIEEICQSLNGEVHFDLEGDLDTLVRETERIAKTHKNLVIGFNFNRDILQILEAFEENLVKIKIKNIQSISQALICLKYGIKIIEINELEESNESNMVEDIISIIRNYSEDVIIIANHIKDENDVVKYSKHGVDGMYLDDVSIDKMVDGTF